MRATNPFAQVRGHTVASNANLTSAPRAPPRASPSRRLSPGCRRRSINAARPPVCRGQTGACAAGTGLAQARVQHLAIIRGSGPWSGRPDVWARGGARRAKQHRTLFTPSCTILMSTRLDSDGGTERETEPGSREVGWRAVPGRTTKMR